MSFIKRIPVPMAALALGTATLGNLLASYSESLRLVLGALAALLVVLVLVRLVLDFRGVAADCANCGVLAVLPTLFMALMVLAVYLKPYAATSAFVLWVGALVAQVGVTALFVKRHLLAFDLRAVLPSWFVVFVGYVVATVTSPAFSMQPLGRVLLYAGLAGYAAVLGVVAYRLVKLGDLPDPALPSLAIIAAPTSLCLAGYLAVTDAKQPAVVYTLLALSAVSLLFVLFRLPKVLRLPFNPGFAALTFPLAITAVAFKQSSAFLASTPSGAFLPLLAVQALEALAALAVAYVFARYVLFLARPQRAS